MAGLRRRPTPSIGQQRSVRLKISVTPDGRLTTESAAAFADLGVDRLVVMPRLNDPAEETVDNAVAAITGLT